MKEKLEQLQIIRFFAFGIIFVRHMEEWVHFPTVRGNMINGITFFFILSGLVNAYSMYGKKIEFSYKEVLKYIIAESKRPDKVGKVIIFSALIVITLAATVIYHYLMHGSNDGLILTVCLGGLIHMRLRLKLSIFHVFRYAKS